MKKILSFMLVVVFLIAFAATGCAPMAPAEETPPEETPAQNDSAAPAEEVVSDFSGQTLEFYMFEGGYGRAWEDAIIEKFEEKYGCTVNITATPQLGDILRPKMIAGQIPDIVILNWGDSSGIVEAMFKENGFEDISDVIYGEELNGKFLDGFLDSPKCSPYGDGKVYLAPLFYTGMGLVYNSKYFEANKLTTPKTWDEFFALGNVDKDRSLFTYQGIHPGYLEIMLFPAIAGAAGVEGLDAFFNYEEGSASTPEVKAVLQNLQKIATDGYLMEGTVALNHTDSQAAFMRGDALFHPNGSWVVNEMAEADREENFEWAVAAPPALNVGQAQYAATGIECVWIPKAAQNKELAKEFLKFMFSEESLLLAAEKAGALLPVKGGLDIAGDKLEQSLYGFYTMFENGALPLFATFAPLPEGTKIDPKAELFNNNITDLMTGNKTVDEVCANMEEAFAKVRDDIEAAK